MRKTQQLDCYAAQEALPRGQAFASLEEVQRWVDDLRDTPWWHLQGYSLHVLRIEVQPYRSAKFAGCAQWCKEDNCGVIALTPDGRTVRTVLHEVAHILADAAHDSTGHDPAWARVFLTLVSCVMGPDAYVTLRESFDAHGVSYDAGTPAASSTFAL